ncbi:unnamed protein product [Didymodactylos carnosus]|nr:unnamed protein product [Didymodactylos carnosus]CAF3528908.1 unnamed protein product [Didymodactylos carnosus]
MTQSNLIDHIQIRGEVSADYSDVYEVNKSAFEQDNEARLVEKLRQNHNFDPNLSYVAIYENGTQRLLVGYLLFFPIKIQLYSKNDNKKLDLSVNECLALAPISVLPSYQNRGIGSKLISYALDNIKRSYLMSYHCIIVLGHENYYPRFGFKPAISQYHIHPPFSIENENCFLVLELIPDKLKETMSHNGNVYGVVEYPKEFDEVS